MNKKTGIIIGALAVVAISAGGLWYGKIINQKKEINQNNALQLDQTNQNIAGSQPDAVNENVQDFYNKYIEIINELTSRENNDTSRLRELRSALLDGFVSDDIKQKVLDGKLGYDSILCAQDVPTCTKADLKKLNDTEAIVLNHEYFSGPTCQMKQEWDNEEEIKLKLVDNQWKIYDISCSNRK